MGAVYPDFSWKNKIRVSCSQIAIQNCKQHEEMIFTEKEKDQVKYDNNMYTVDTCIYILELD